MYKNLSQGKDLRGRTKFMGYGWNLKIDVTKKSMPLYNSREKCYLHTDDWLKKYQPYTKFYLKVQTALATGHFSNQLEHVGVVTPPPPPPPPVQARMCSISEDMDNWHICLN